MNYRIFIQARMSSARFPGKMLAPFRGRPLIAQVLGRFRETDLWGHLVVLTSSDASDDPLADFVVNRCGVPVFRGDLDDVVGRFQSALSEHPCPWFVRISGDSPLIDPALVQAMIDLCAPDYDLVSNVVRRTFPPGQSVECVRSETFRILRSVELTLDQREHVTRVFYERPGTWRVRSVTSTRPEKASTRMVVDTIEDLRDLEARDNFSPAFAALAMPEVA
jgi:spore coat polysaccharide biosynthesis protein SpsF